jgi:hypothetical protein
MAMLIAVPRWTSAALPWLRAGGMHIVDDNGRSVQLHGINIGGWLVEEMWMMPFETKEPPAGMAKIIDHVTLWRCWNQRFGEAKAAELRTKFRDAWLNEADFDRMQSAGFNCVRLPFLSSLLDEPEGWSWLDRAVGWAGRRRIYVVLDMHGAPGSQNKDQTTGEAGRNALFKDPANVGKAISLWQAIAKRYRDNPAVAGFDLLNEPMGAPSQARLQEVHNQLYKAIRQVDERHIIFVEDGYRGIKSMPRPAGVGWQNVVLSLHYYRFHAKSPADQEQGLIDYFTDVVKTQPTLGAPLFIGEFNQEPWGNEQARAHFAQLCRLHDWSWSFWCYKTVMPGGHPSSWGWYSNGASTQMIDPYRDSYDEIVAKLPQLRTENLVQRKNLLLLLENGNP